MKIHLALQGLTAVGVVAGAASCAATGGFKPPHLHSDYHEQCPINSPFSCTTTGKNETCCLESDFGLFMSTQLWDYKPACGPENDFTLHGTWSNKCNNDFDQFCRPEWYIEDPVAVLKNSGNQKLLDRMNQIWTNVTGPNSDMWIHEFNKHGSCMRTLGPDCYSSPEDEFQNAVDYYTTSVALYDRLPTAKWLKEAGIEPSETAQHSVDDIQRALSSKFGTNSVKIWCDDDNVLTQVMYFFHLSGSVGGGHFKPVDAPVLGNCKDGLTWKPKQF